MVDYVNVRLERPVLEQVRRLTIQLSAAADARLSQSEAVAAALAYAGEHIPEIAERLRTKGND